MLPVLTSRPFIEDYRFVTVLEISTAPIYSALSKTQSNVEGRLLPKPGNPAGDVRSLSADGGDGLLAADAELQEFRAARAVARADENAPRNQGGGGG